MFGHKSEPSRRYSYGAREPVVGLSEINNQLYLAHKYGNALVELELYRRKKYRELRTQYSPELQQIEQSISEARQQLSDIRTNISVTNSTNRKRVILDSATKEVVSQIKLRMKDLISRSKILRKQLNSDTALKTQAQLVEHEVLVKQKELYATFNNLGWGTKSVVLQGRIKHTGNDPRFASYNGGGQLSFQIQKPKTLSFEQLLSGKDSRVKLCITKELSKNKYGILSIRLTQSRTDKTDNPVWVQIPVNLHRDIPKDGSIKWIHIIKRKIATRYKWEIHFVVAKESWDDKGNAIDGIAAIDAGWRLVDKGLRVLCWHGHDNQSGELIIPNQKLKQWQQVVDLQSIRDNKYNTILEHFQNWLSTHKDNIPEVLAEQLKYISKWKSQKRLYIFHILWKNNRFDGDSSIFDIIEQWSKNEKHLYIWQEYLRRKTLNWRKDLYRNFNIFIRDKYKNIVLEDLNWANLKRNINPEEEKKLPTTQYRDIASVGLLNKVLEEGGSTTFINAKKSSMICNNCKNECNPDGKEQFHTCEHCNTTWDRDVNAANNLCERYIAAKNITSTRGF